MNHAGQGVDGKTSTQTNTNAPPPSLSAGLRFRAPALYHGDRAVTLQPTPSHPEDSPSLRLPRCPSCSPVFLDLRPRPVRSFENQGHVTVSPKTLLNSLKRKGKLLPGGWGALKLCLTWGCPAPVLHRAPCLPGEPPLLLLRPCPSTFPDWSFRPPPRAPLKDTCVPTPLKKGTGYEVSTSEPQKGCRKCSQVLGWLNQGTTGFQVNPRRRNSARGQKSQGHSAGCYHILNLYLTSVCTFRG